MAGVASETEPGPPGSLRVLVPAVTRPTPVRIVAHAPGGRSDVELTLPVVRRWTVHLIHHSHLDIGYTDPQPIVLANQSSFLDSALDLVAATDTLPDDARFRWCAESLWPFQRWAASRPRDRVEAFVERVREGRIELSAMPFNLHTEACSTSELFELLRGARDVAEAWDLPLVSAMQTDVPGAVGALPDALGEAGVRYLAVAHNWAGRSVPHLLGEPAPRLFRWRGPAGHEVLTWMTDTPLGLAYAEGALVGFSESIDHVDDLLPAYLSAIAATRSPYGGDLMGFARGGDAWTEPGHPFDLLHLRVIGRFADNTAPSRVVADVVRDWGERWAWPRVRLSTNADFFEEAEATLGDRIPTLTGDWNDWWSDGLGSAAQEIAIQRGAQATAPDADTVGSLAAALGAPEPPDLDARRRAIHASLALFDEHTFGAADPWGEDDEGKRSGRKQWAWKAARALEAHDRAADLMADSLVRLGAQVGPAREALASLAIVNPSGWARTDAVAAFVPDAVVPVGLPIAVVDARTGRVLRADEEPPANDEHRDAGRVVRFIVEDVPAVGLVRVDLVGARELKARPMPVGASDARSTTLSNGRLTVTVDLERACIGSIVEARTGRELVGEDTAFGFGAYVHDRYAAAGLFNHASSRLEASDRLELLGSRSAGGPAVLVRRASTACGEVLVYEHAVDGVRSVRTTLTLAPDADHLDIEVRIAKDATVAKESGYVTFPFAMRDPSVRVDVTGGIVGTGIASIPGAATHVRAMRDWVSLEEDGLAVAWATRDVPLVHVGGLPLPYAPFPPTVDPEPGTIVSWVHNNVWDTNFPAQQGFERTFRYRVAAAPSEGAGSAAILAQRTAAGATHPLLAVLARGPVGAADASPSLLRVEDPAVALVDVVHQGSGTFLVRLRSVTDEPVSTAIHAGLPVTGARRSTYLGTAGDALPVRDGAAIIDLAPRATAALLLTLEGTIG